MSGIKILNREGLEFLSEIPDKSIDLVLTDPPYITSRDSGMDKWVEHVEKRDEDSEPFKSLEEWKLYYPKVNWLNWYQKEKSLALSNKLKVYKNLKSNFLKYGSIYGKKYAVRTNYGDWDSKFTIGKLEVFVRHFYRILRDGGTCIMFFDIWKLSTLKVMMENEKFKQPRFIEWIKTNPQPINSKRNYLTNCREIALLGVKKGKPTFNSSYDNAIYKYPLYGGKDRFHPTQKSLKLFEDLIKKHSNEGDLILDCFLGSGTTAIAAHNTNRNFTGCELDKEYYDKTVQRLDDRNIEYDL
tara:strand:- start:583 stop:1476 length:894 start_codon:yes stop_codon:yes gene_type:complete